MYDLTLEMLSVLFRHGFSVGGAVAIVLVLLRQRYIKKRLSRYFPWIFDGDNEVKAYMGNQLIIMKNQELIMDHMGVEPCQSGNMTRLNEPVQRNLNALSKLSRAESVLEQEVNMKTIVIDAGHGGKDPGAIGTTGAYEKDFALTMALKLEARLLGSEVTAILTRKTDTYLDLGYRAKIANDIKADGFISIHANSSNTQASGTETFYTRADSQKLAELLNRYMVGATGLRDRGAKIQNLAVTKQTTMPAALLEVGFINHPGDEIKLLDNDFQDRVIESIVKAILEYFVVKDRPSKSEVIDHPYPVMDVVVHAHEPQSYIGYNVKSLTWIPSRPVGELLGATIDYKNKKVTINGNPVETLLINGLGYVKSRDLTAQLGAKVFWDKANPKMVDIYKGE